MLRRPLPFVSLASFASFVSLASAISVFVACSSDSERPNTEPADESESSSSSSGASELADAEPVEAAVPLPPPYVPAGYTAVPFLSATPLRQFPAAASVLVAGQDYVATIETSAGRMVFDLYEVETPNTVNSFVFLALHRYYEQIAFHRVIDEFMAQTGDPNSVSGRKSTWGRGGPGYEFGIEVRPELTFAGPGVLGMARSDDPGSNGSQFFVTFTAQPGLDQQYTVWGRLLEGMEVLPGLVRGEPPETPTRITQVGIAVKPR